MKTKQSKTKTNKPKPQTSNHSKTKTHNFKGTLCILLIFVFNLTTTQQCGLGCLRCDRNTDSCLLCDFQNFFYFDFESQMCQRRKMSNCVLGLIEGDCLLCENNRYPKKRENVIVNALGYVGNACYPNSSEEDVKDCELFYARGKCARCRTGFILRGNGDDIDQCVKAGFARIKNCKVYGENECLACDKGFRYNYVSGQCVSWSVYVNDTGESSKDGNCLSRNLNLNCPVGPKCTAAAPSINLNSVLHEAVLLKNDRLLRQVLRFKALDDLGVLHVSPFMRYYVRIESTISRETELAKNPDFLNINYVERPWMFSSLDTQLPGSQIWTNRKAGTFSIVQLLYPFCQSINKFEKCTECVRGYYLDQETRQCLDMRSFEINKPACAIWENVDRCFECSSGYQLNSLKKCELKNKNVNKSSEDEEVVIMQMVTINTQSPEEVKTVDVVVDKENVKEVEKQEVEGTQEKVVLVETGNQVKGSGGEGNVNDGGSKVVMVSDDTGIGVVDITRNKGSDVKDNNDDIKEMKEEIVVVNDKTGISELGDLDNSKSLDNVNEVVVSNNKNGTDESQSKNSTNPNITNEVINTMNTINTINQINQNNRNTQTNKKNPTPQKVDIPETVPKPQTNIKTHNNQETNQIPIINLIPNNEQIEISKDEIQPPLPSEASNNQNPRETNIIINQLPEGVSTDPVNRSNETIGSQGLVNEDSDVLNESFEIPEEVVKNETEDSTIRTSGVDVFGPAKRNESLVAEDNEPSQKEIERNEVVIVPEEKKEEPETVQIVEETIKQENPNPIINNNNQTITQPNEAPNTTTQPEKTPQTPLNNNPNPNNPPNQISPDNINSRLLNLFNLGAVRPTKVEGLSLLTENGSESAYLQNQKYVVRRRYFNPANSNTMERDYVFVYTGGNILIAYDENKVQGKDLSTFQLNQKNITQNCVEAVLKEDLKEPLVSCVKCLDSKRFVLTPFDSVESDIMICRSRLKKIEFCVDYDPLKEKCIECEDNYFLFSNNSHQKCLPGIPGCNKNIITNNRMICSACRENLFLENNTCKDIKRDITNCKINENGTCVACEPGHFLYNNSCLTTLIYSFFFCPLTESNFCDCGDSALEVRSVDECIQISGDNCAEYLTADQAVCAKCRNGFYLNVEFNCLTGEIPFCLVYGDPLQDSQICQKCEEGYVLENNTCRKSMQIFTENCMESKGEQCLKCSDETFRLTFPERRETLGVCGLNTFFDSQPKIRNCLVFDQEKDTCLKCRPPFFADVNGACARCDLTTHGIDNFNQKCLQKDNIIPNCELYDESFCVKCRDNTGPWIINPNDYTVALREYTDVLKNEFTQGPSYVIDQCAVSLSDSCKTEHCAHAVSVDDNTTCCFKCTQGRTGIWSHTNENFYVSSCDRKVEFCKTDSKIKGIPINYQKYLTCNECTENKIIHLNLLEDETQIQCMQRPANRVDLANCLILVEGDCRICKPKYIQRTTESGDKIQCVEIPNCLFSETVEKCEQCMPGFSLSSNGSECVSSPIDNCKEVNDQLTCVKCLDGMVLNQNYCFQLNMPDCLNFKGENCVSCNLKENNGVFENILINMIFTSPSLTDQPTKSMCLKPNEAKATVPNCKIYETPFFCKECNIGYILQQNSLSNTTTQTCIPDPQSTLNCKMVGPRSECIQCQKGHYLEADRCIQGAIRGCVEYSNMLNCAKCEENYTLIRKNNRNLCYFAYAIDNCADTQFKLSGSGKLDLECARCSSLFRRKQLTVANKLCFPLRSVPHCKKFDSDSAQCEECDDLYFVNADRTGCLKRTNLNIKNCVKFDALADTCESCSDNLTFDAGVGLCIPLSFENIPKCVVQLKGEQKCLLCERDHVLTFDNQCKAVDSLIPNCLEYSLFNTCTKCQQGFVSQKTGECLQINDRPIKMFDISAISIRNPDPEIFIDPSTVTPLVPNNNSVNNTLGASRPVSANEPGSNGVNPLVEKELNDLEISLLPVANDDVFDQEVKKIINENENLRRSAATENLRILQENPLINLGADTLLNNLLPGTAPKPKDPLNQAKDELVKSISNSAATTVLGDGANPIVKNLVSQQIQEGVNGKIGSLVSDEDIAKMSSHEIKEGISLVKNDLNKNLENLNDSHISLLTQQLNDLKSDNGKILVNPQLTNIKNSNNQITSEAKPVEVPNTSSSTIEETPTSTINSNSSSNSTTETLPISTSTPPNNNASPLSVPFDFDKVVVQYNDSERFKNFRNSKLCGLCDFNFEFSTKSGKCTKMTETGCLVKNKPKEATMDPDLVYMPCLVCMPGYSQSSSGSCIENLMASVNVVGLMCVLWYVLAFLSFE